MCSQIVSACELTWRALTYGFVAVEGLSLSPHRKRWFGLISPAFLGSKINLANYTILFILASKHYVK